MAAYESLCKLISQELPFPLDNMNSCKNKKDKTSRRPFHKTLWDSELQSKRKEVRCALKVWLNSKFISSLKSNYQVLQQEFDKLVRHKKRQYQSTQRQKLLVLQKHNPRSFWDNILKISISNTSNKCNIPWKVISQDQIYTDNSMVLQVWKDTYYKLYNYPVLLESSTDYYFSYSNIIHNCSE